MDDFVLNEDGSIRCTMFKRLSEEIKKLTNNNVMEYNEIFIPIISDKGKEIYYKILDAIKDIKKSITRLLLTR